MPQLITNGAFDPANLQVDDLYIQIVPPPAAPTGVPTDVVAVIGTAPWGALNSPVLLGSPQDGARAYGKMSVASLTDAHDLPTEIVQLFAQAPSQAQLQVWASRVSDGTDSPAIASPLDNVTPTAAIGGTAFALYSGSGANGMQMIINPSTIPNAFDVTIANFPGSPGELFPRIKTAGTGGFWANLATALASGMSGIRPPSAFARFVAGTPTQVTAEVLTVAPTPNGTLKNFSGTLAVTPVLKGTLVITDSHGKIFSDRQGNGTLITTDGIAGPVGTGTINYATGQFTLVYGTAPITGTTFAGDYKDIATDANPPKAGTYTFAGGTDGRNVTSAMLLGDDTALPRTGLYALRALPTTPGLGYIAGLTDTTIIASLQGFADSEGIAMAFAFATGTTSQAAVTAKQASGVDDFEMLWLKDWIYFFDSVNNRVRLIPPYSTVLGRIATLPPSVSPGNKQVYGIVGTERNSPYVGNIPYSLAEIGLLESNGILFVTNPIPAGPQFGIRHGQNGYPVAPQDDVAYTRMTNFIAHSLETFMGQFVNQPQTQSPKDPTRDAIKTVLNAFFQNLQDLGQIDTRDVNGGPGFLVVCDLTNNTPQQIAARYCFAACRVVYLSNIRFLIVSLQGGTTVVTQGNSQSQALAGQ